jgi:hypothetical protein
LRHSQNVVPVIGRLTWLKCQCKRAADVPWGSWMFIV